MHTCIVKYFADLLHVHRPNNVEIYNCIQITSASVIIMRLIVTHMVVIPHFLRDISWYNALNEVIRKYLFKTCISADILTGQQ